MMEGGQLGPLSNEHMRLHHHVDESVLIHSFLSVELKGVAQFLMQNTVLMLGLEMGDVSASCCHFFMQVKDGSLPSLCPDLSDTE